MRTIAMGGVRTMSKPTTFNYQDYVQAQNKIQEQAAEIIRLKKENTNLKIHIRILMEDKKK